MFCRHADNETATRLEISITPQNGMAYSTSHQQVVSPGEQEVGYNMNDENTKPIGNSNIYEKRNKRRKSEY